MLTRIAGCRVCSAENLLVWIWIFKPNKEQSINRDTKSKVGIIAFSLDKSAVQRWLLASYSCTCNDHTAGLPWDCWKFDQKYRRRKGVNEPVYILRGVRTNTKKLNHLKFEMLKKAWANIKSVQVFQDGSYKVGSSYSETKRAAQFWTRCSLHVYISRLGRPQLCKLLHNQSVTWRKHWPSS